MNTEKIEIESDGYLKVWRGEVYYRSLPLVTNQVREESSAGLLPLYPWPQKYDTRKAVNKALNGTKPCGLTCPRCNAPEMHPNEDLLLIRAYKVESDGHWWSECLVCASADGTATGGYDRDLVWNSGVEFQAGRHNSTAWF